MTVARCEFLNVLMEKGITVFDFFFWKKIILIKTNRYDAVPLRRSAVSKMRQAVFHLSWYFLTIPYIPQFTDHFTEKTMWSILNTLNCFSGASKYSSWKGGRDTIAFSYYIC